MARADRFNVGWRVAQLVAVPLARILMGTRIANPEKLPATGSFIVVPNHFSDVDPIIVGLAVWRAGRFPHFLAKESIFRVPVVGWFMRATRMVPVLRISWRCR